MCCPSLGRKGKHINKIPWKMLGQSRDNPGIIPGQSCEISSVYFLLSCLISGRKSFEMIAGLIPHEDSCRIIFVLPSCSSHKLTSPLWSFQAIDKSQRAEPSTLNTPTHRSSSESVERIGLIPLHKSFFQQKVQWELFCEYHWGQKDCLPNFYCRQIILGICMCFLCM